THFVYNNASTGAPINIGVNRTYTDETGWLNYIWVIARRALTMYGSQMPFRDYRCIGTNAVSQFNLQSTSPNIRIWNVTDQFNISEQQTTFASNNYSFTIATDTLKQFIAFDSTASFKAPAYIGQLAPQNLHAMVTGPADYIIVAPQSFLNQAQRLADLHKTYEHLSYVIVTPDQIYNEFSSGAQDLMAIRQFVRMYYKTASRPPQYLLLFGTGSYQQKNRYDPSNTVLVPTFETYNSWSFINSKTGDDFYAFLDDNEGIIDTNGTPTGLIDIGAGRLTVKNVSEANGVTNKIYQYYNRVEPTSSCCDQATQNTPDWRNWVSVIADDANPGSSGEDQFFHQQETNASTIQNIDPRFNVDKIYEDAYPVEAVPGGRRYPDVNTAINNRIAKGALIMSYSGHGDVLELSHEEIITVSQIQQWNNINNMPLFFTATCEFSRYDDPTLESAGEDILLNPNGAGIGLFTTTRVAYVQDGTNLGKYFYSAALDSMVSGRRPTLGDIIRITKANPARSSYLHFALLGDPALTLSYPKQYTSPVSINSHVYTANVNDTLSALGKYTVTGYISDVIGNKLTSFNGTMYISVFDKPSLLTTLNNSQNTPTSTYVLNFFQQKSVLYKGQATVKNGDFTFTFIVPKDIMYNFGNGKISYYAQTDTTDASGWYGQIIVGGTSNTPIVDNQGPGIKLYMNDDKFVSGGTT
ncbi:MAG TPA: type IX secretion system sortase PorU, partial [Bacteroidia bacterium]|nr:type IX secretion system sortase PorU [Bacteroidia bacterium]